MNAARRNDGFSLYSTLQFYSRFSSYFAFACGVVLLYRPMLKIDSTPEFAVSCLMFSTFAVRGGRAVAPRLYLLFPLLFVVRSVLSQRLGVSLVRLLNLLTSSCFHRYCFFALVLAG